MDLTRASDRVPPSLLSAFPNECWLFGSDIDRKHSVDWSAESPFQPEVLFRPTGAEQLSRFVASCAELAQPLVVQGGLTGLVGGATPQRGEWVVSLDRLNAKVDVDRDAMTLRAAAGVPLARMQAAAEAAGLTFPVDLGARGTATAGGLVATNAGGNRVIRYGMMRASVVALEAVLPDGRIFRGDRALPKDNAGFDLKQLLVGTEGTLGIITEVTFALRPAPGALATALCAAPTFDAVLALLRRARERSMDLAAYEVMWRPYYEAAIEAVRVVRPFSTAPEFCCLIAVDVGDVGNVEAFEAMLGELLDERVLEDAIIANSEADVAAFWSVRDAIGALLGRLAPLANFDVGVPIPAMAAFTETVCETLSAQFPGVRALFFGHVADANLHLVASTGRAEDVPAIYKHVYKLTGEFGGTISAEHGVGVIKKPYLTLCRSETDIDLMRQLKRTLDPANILNRGRVV